MDQRAAEKTYGLAGEQLTPAVSWTLPSLRKAWNEAKGDVAPWWAENSKEAYAAGIRDLVRGVDAWRDSKSGKREGPKVKFPRFKGKRRDSSCTFTTGVIRVEADRKHVTLPRLATSKLPESARELARRLDAGTARILSATVKWRAAGGMCRSPSRSTGRPAPRPGRTRWSAWTSGSSTSRCCPPAT